jgi:hypothetical protein
VHLKGLGQTLKKVLMDKFRDKNPDSFAANETDSILFACESFVY